ncbi:MAG: ABC transporter permease [bacterium]|nr:ABC transporter permease [bacterium]
MNYLDRMIQSIIGNKRNTILMLLICLVLSALILISLCIKTTAANTVDQIRNSVETNVNVYTSSSYDSNAACSSLISENDVEQLRKSDNVKDANYYIRSLAYATDFTSKITNAQEANEERKKEELARDKAQAMEKAESSGMVLDNETLKQYDYVPPYNVYVQGNTDTKYNLDFSNGMAQLFLGRLINESDDHACIIHVDLAKDNGLTLGSTITIENLNKKQVRLKVVGIYYRASDNANYIYSPYMNLENAIYTDLVSCYELNENKNLTTVQFAMRDPELNSSFRKQVKGIADNKYLTKADDNSYQMIAGTLRITIVITNVVLIAILLLGAVILTLVVAISMRDRDYEIGILLSMGEQKYKIIIQMLGELLLPTIAGGMLGIVASVCVEGIISKLLGNIVQLSISISFSSIGWMFLSAIGLTMLGAVIMIVKVLRYQPKSILMHIE